MFHAHSSSSSSSSSFRPLHINIEAAAHLNRTSPFKISPRYALFTDRFNSKNAEGAFLGETSDQRESEQYCQFIQTSSMARTKFQFEEKGTLVHGRPVYLLEPSPQAIARTKRAVSAFFSLAYQILNRKNAQFPLAGKNKCLGMVAVPETNLVMIAISQDKNPENDLVLRHEIVKLLNDINWTL